MTEMLIGCGKAALLAPAHVVVASPRTQLVQAVAQPGSAILQPAPLAPIKS